MSQTNKIPMRKCVGCNQMFSKKELWRIVLTPDQKIILDASSKANGRGVYLCPKKECLQQARKTKALERSLKHQITDELYDLLAMELS